MPDALAAVVVSRKPNRSARVRTMVLTSASRSGRADLIGAIAVEHRAPFVEADEDGDAGRAVDPAAFTGLDLHWDVGLANGVDLGVDAVDRLADLRSLILDLTARGEAVEVFVERV